LYGHIMVKDKRRNSEKRKEKSRDAARCRRGKETEVFLELASSLPLQDSVTGQLDKASVMRLTISKLKIDHILHQAKLDQDGKKENEMIKQEDKFDQYYQKALEGFSFILSSEADIIYMSETVVKYLGLQQLDLMGQSIYDFTHPCDHDEIKEMLTIKSGVSTAKNSSNPGHSEAADRRVFFLRMKCTLTSKGRNVNLKSATYKVMKCTGRIVSEIKNSEANVANELTSGLYPYMVGIVEPIPHPANIEVILDSKTFLTKHNMDMSFIFCDERIAELAGYSSEEMVNQSFYDFPHALDSGIVDKAFKNLFSKGQTATGAYRFLAYRGGYIWVVTQATVINNSRTQKPQSVVCVHYVLSGIEKEDLILSHVQKPLPKASILPPPIVSADLSNLLPPKLELNTENIFAPKPKDMDEGYFVPSEMKDTLRYLNNEPEDLSYLAPAVSIDQSDALPIFAFGANTLGSPLMKQEPSTASATPEPCCQQNILPQISPTSNYGSMTSPAMLSSNTSSRIASPNDYLSMAMPEDMESMDKFFQSIKTGGEDENEAINFDMRAPYIPMDGEEDLGLLAPSSNDLFHHSKNVDPGLFGRTDSVFGPKDGLFEETPEPPKRSVRDMLGGSTAVASIEKPPDTMFLQLKRPLDMNSLETGPPQSKVMRLGCQTAAPSPASASINQSSGDFTSYLPRQNFFNNSTKDSVLMNLLLSGEDRNYGYKVRNSQGQVSNQIPKTTQEIFLAQMLPSMTQQDYQVNAPAAEDTLVQGLDIIRALDIKIVPNCSVAQT